MIRLNFMFITPTFDNPGLEFRWIDFFLQVFLHPENSIFMGYRNSFLKLGKGCSDYMAFALQGEGSAPGGHYDPIYFRRLGSLWLLFDSI